VSKEDGIIEGYNGNRHWVKMMKGWDICIEWQDISTSWLPLKDTKDANPVELADYAIANKLSDEPTFAWWLPEVLKWKNRIVNCLKSRYWCTMHKFGIKIPKSIEHALWINQETGTNYWQRAIKKEMKNVCIAFQK